ncbi:MAG: hypothetical protein JNM66_01540 [Bryobacterales bacterium]|nr:hypothetical protein [Bryobacterales bacterium]
MNRYIIPALAMVLAGAAFAQQPGAGFAVVGVAASQTARINVVNEGVPAPPGQDGEVLPPCRVVLQFYGADGGLIKERVLEELAPGKIGYLDLTKADRPANEVRTPIRAVARFGYSGGANPPRALLEGCRILPSLEIFDAETGKAELVITEAKPLPVSSIAVP